MSVFNGVFRLECLSDNNHNMHCVIIYRLEDNISTDKDLAFAYSCYIASCMSYAVLATAIVFDLRENYQLIGNAIIPCPEVAAMMLFANSVCAFHADVLYCPLLYGFPFNRVHMKNGCICQIWLRADRIFATVTGFLFSLNWFKLSWSECMGMTLLVFVAIIQLVMSRVAAKRYNIKEYIYYHTIWHLYLPTMFLCWLYLRPIYIHLNNSIVQ